MIAKVPVMTAVNKAVAVVIKKEDRNKGWFMS